MIRIERNPSRGQLAVFGLAWLLFFGILGTIAWWKTALNLKSAALWTVAIAIPAVGVAWPEFLRRVYLLAIYATFPIGFVLSFVILLMIYYMVLTPIGIVLRLTGYDPMQRRFDRTANTYWTPRDQEEKTERYFQQF